jgi:hypothetical protein
LFKPYLKPLMGFEQVVCSLLLPQEDKAGGAGIVQPHCCRPRRCRRCYDDNAGTCGVNGLDVHSVIRSQKPSSAFASSFWSWLPVMMTWPVGSPSPNQPGES